MSGCDDRVWAIIVRILNFCCGVLLIIFGVLKYVDHDDEDNKLIYCKNICFNKYEFIFYRYLVYLLDVIIYLFINYFVLFLSLFGILIIIAEIRINCLLTYF